MLELKHIYYEKDNKKILNDINLTLDNNKFYVITGPNGSGKSTLAKILMGILKPTKGQIIFNDKDITNLSIDERAKLGIGYAFQQPVKFKGITVSNLLKLSYGKELDWKETCNVLSKVGLCAKEYSNREVNDSLSGGELKRIELATVILRKNKISIFDEPEAGIDLWSFENLIDIFEEIRNTVKSTTIVISHQEKIINIADEVILIEQGKVKEMGKSADIIKKSISKKCCKLKEGDMYEK